ncbi:MAG: taurine dioxygenase [Actinomycetota bacterium]|jgi:taurine dioxygenase
MGGLKVRQLTGNIGAEIGGIQIADEHSDDTIAEIRAALLAHKVIFFRGQTNLTPERHIAFGRRFGELEVHPLTPPDQPNPELFRIPTGGKYGGPDIWHSDVTWRPEPSLGSILAMRKLPKLGGDTIWADMGLAFDMLPEDIKERIRGLEAVHDFTRAFGRGQTEEVKARMREENPPQLHPVVRTHPETGRDTLYVNPSFTSHIDGMDAEESTALLDRLYRQMGIPDVQVRFRWTRTSVAFWDNRATQHYAVNDYLPSKRTVERVTIVGDKPFYRAV